MLKSLPAKQETWVWFVGWENPLEKEIKTHASILECEIPWTENTVGYNPWGITRVGHHFATKPPPPTWYTLNHRYDFLRQQDLFKSSYIYSVQGNRKWCSGHEACSVTRLRQTSIPGVRRGCPSSPVTCTRLTVWTTPPAFRILWLGQLCSVLPPASQKQSHVSHTPQPPESRWVRKDPVGEGYGGNRGSSRHWPGSLDEGARSVGSIGTSHLWRAIPSRILSESEDLGSCGWVLPIPISVLSRAGGTEADDTGGQGETPVSTVRAVYPVGPRSPDWHFYHEKGARGPTPRTPLRVGGSWRLQSALSNRICRTAR